MPMACIIYRTDSKSGNVYAYESRSYRDPVTKRPRSKQVYLGRVDPITKEIRPKGKNGKRNRYQASAQVDALREELAADKQAIKEAKEKIASLEGKVNRAGKFYVEMKDLITQYEDSLGSEGTGGESI